MMLDHSALTVTVPEKKLKNISSSLLLTKTDGSYLHVELSYVLKNMW